ncbi:MAG: hypothetical protein EZS28_012919 [Streblomastix strix]|uniref:Uncharacterized protein n=1 Tax=Streblomastix strix TaxID=222440 RepID=A0A5J4WA72_9EUKA|nr:MAG: hypothetical protein EZS28_012919 [Streblomastix strix]
MTIYSRDEESGSFEFIDHQKIYQQVFSVHCVPQSHSVDCLLIVTVNGEWLFLQWHESNFFPLGTGKLFDAVSPYFNKPIKRRFRLDPTFQWAVSVIPQDSNSSHYFTRPSDDYQLIKKQDNQINEEINNLMSIDDVQIARVSFRALCVVDETVFVGLSYDGPDASFMYNVSEKMNETLGSIPQSQHWRPNMVAGISNGLEETWLTQQMNNIGNQTQQSSQLNQEVKTDQIKINIACSKTFLFTEDEEDELNNGNYSSENSLFNTITRVRHAVFTSKLLLQEFPFQINDETEKDISDSSSESRSSLNSSSKHMKVLNKKITPNITTAKIIVDTIELPCQMNISFDFQTHQIHLFGRVLISIHPACSRIILLGDEGEQLDYTAIMKTVRGADFVHCDNLGGFTRNEVLHILSGKEITTKPNQNGEESRSNELLKVRDKIRSWYLTARSFGITLDNKHECRALFINISGSYLFQFPISFLDPPMAAMYVSAKQGNGIKVLSPQQKFASIGDTILSLSPNSIRMKSTYKHIHQTKEKEKPSQFDKIFIGGGKQLLVIMNGKAQVHHMKDKCIKDIILIPTSHHNIQKINSKLKISEEVNEDSSLSIKSDEGDIHHFKKFWKQLSTSAIFISTTCGSPVLISFDMKQLLDVEQQEDFALSPGCIQQAIPIPTQFKVPSHFEEDRMLLGMGNGRTGSLQLVNISNKLLPFAETAYLGKHSFASSCRLYTGSTLRNVILVEADDEHNQNIQPQRSPLYLTFQVIL